MKYSIFFFSLLLTVSHAFAQTDKKVSTIRKKVEQINNDTGYIKRTFDEEQFAGHITDGGGELTGYFKDGQLVKIVENIGFSIWTITYDYYLQNDSLIFVYGQQRDFVYVDSIGTFDFTKQTLALECRYYFNNNQLIKTDFKGKPARLNDPPSDKDAEGLKTNCAKYATLLITRNKP